MTTTGYKRLEEERTQASHRGNAPSTISRSPSFWTAEHNRRPLIVWNTVLSFPHFISCLLCGQDLFSPLNIWGWQVPRRLFSFSYWLADQSGSS